MRRNSKSKFVLILTGFITLGSFFIGYFLAEHIFDSSLSGNVGARHAVPLRTDPEFQSPVYSHGITPASLFENAYDSLGDLERTKSRSAISAHHLLVAKDIAYLFETISDEHVETVVLIGPNHFSQGRSALQTSMGTWTTPFGEVETDRGAVQKLLDAVPSLKREEQTFTTEHSISALTPFIRRSFPDAKIVPLVVHETISDEDRHALAEAIRTVLPDAVVIASIDMSHNLPLAVANFHDEITLDAIQGRQTRDRPLNLEIDSNASLSILQEINSARGEEGWNLTHHGSSLGSEATKKWEENTSHILGYFTDGASDPKPVATLHIVGDIMLDRNVRRLIEKDGYDAPWKYLTRFLSGVDLRVGNLEGTVNERESKHTADPPFEFVFTPESVEILSEHIDAVSLANNHASDVGSAGELETREWLDQIGVQWFGSYRSPAPRLDKDINGIPITLIGYHQFQPDLKTLTDEISQANQAGRFVIVLPHWGNEYVTQSGSQRDLATRMIRVGADLIIGGHPHVIQGVEVIEGTPVVYSLGNFIFDQKFGETTTGLTVGLIVSNNEIKLHLLPVGTNGGQPTPLSEDQTGSILERIANQSTPDLRDQIRAGIISQSYE